MHSFKAPTRHFILAAVVILSLVFYPFYRSPSAAAYSDPVTAAPTASRVIRSFDKPAQNWRAGHRGVDLELGIGREVKAAGAGTVAFAGSVAGRPSVSILHADGIRTTYTPVFARVNSGDTVFEGQVIGTLAPALDNHSGLHWAALKGKDDYINPLSLLAKPTIRLKPVQKR